MTGLLPSFRSVLNSRITKIALLLLEILVLLWLLDPLGWYMTTYYAGDLVEASFQGEYQAVRSLLQWGVNPNVKETFKWDEIPMTPLAIATKKQEWRIVNLLLKYGANPNVKDDHLTPLHRAVRAGKKDLVLRLLRAGANPNIRDGKNRTPVFMTSDPELIRRLAKAGVNFNVVSGGRGMDRLSLAAYRGDTQVVTLLLKLEADPNHKLKPFNRTPFFHAAASGEAKSVCDMLRFGADPTIRLKSNSEKGRTPLEWAKSSLQKLDEVQEWDKKLNHYVPSEEDYQKVIRIIRKSQRIYGQSKKSDTKPSEKVWSAIKSLCTSQR